MRRLPPVILALALVLLNAGPAAAVPYSLEIARPRGTDGVAHLTGHVTIAADVSGLGGPSDVAYELTGVGLPWDQTQAVPLTDDGAGRYQRPLFTESLANGVYRLRVRAWGGSAGTYDPEDDATYASASLEVRITNAPDAPANLDATGGGGTASAVWPSVGTAYRSDFAGYEVYLALADAQGVCPAFGDAYSLRATTFATSYTEGNLDPARYCFRVRALRTSPDTATVASIPTDAALASVSAGSGAVSGSPNPNDPNGQYSPGLPYTPVTEFSPIPGGEGSPGPQALEAGAHEQRNRWLLMAGGLSLAACALLLRRYVRTAPRE